MSHVPELLLPPAARAEAREMLRRRGVDSGERMIAFHPGGEWLRGLKRWLAERFAALGDRLQRRWDARILLLGHGEGEARTAAQIGAMMRLPPILTTDGLPLLTSLALIDSCDLFVGNDSGLPHAAAALGRPYVGIFGPTCPDNFHPLPRDSRQGTLVTPHVPCRTSLLAVLRSGAALVATALAPRSRLFRSMPFLTRWIPCFGGMRGCGW